MKLPLRPFLFFFILFAFNVCTKEISREGNNANIPGTGDFYATIGGKISQTGGTVTIISNNTTTRRISGTFNFVATPVGSGPMANLTQGYFAANY
jgi:hypothetical protein